MKILDEVKFDFEQYANEVNEARAIPSLEDGLKPVVRRLLWTMYEGKYFSSKSTVKSAVPVSECLGKYHPHGDAALYEALVNITKNWVHNCPLIDFQGANGGRNDEAAAAMRYTECRLSKYGEALLQDISPNTTVFTSNYLDTLREPVYLPGLFPHLLVNYTMGIGVAVATSFLPHNLSDILAAIKYRINHPDCTCADLNLHPSFPTGGEIINSSELPLIYERGAGRVVVRGKYKIERGYLVFYELPFYIKPNEVIKQIEKLGFEVIDESEDLGIRLIIKAAEEDISYLYKETDLETSLSINMNVLINGKLAHVNLLDVLDFYIKQQHSRLSSKAKEIITQSSAKMEIQKGLLKALDVIDIIIDVIRSSKSREDAAHQLLKQFKFTKPQVDAILAITLARLTKMGREEIEKEIKTLQNTIEYWQNIYNSKSARVDLWEQEVSILPNNKPLNETTLSDLIKVNTEEDLVRDRITITHNSTVYKHSRFEEIKLKKDDTIFWECDLENTPNLQIKEYYYPKEMIIKLASIRGKTLRKNANLTGDNLR